MPAFNAIQLLNREKVTCLELLDCIQSLSRECGHIEAMILMGFREKQSGQKSLDYLQFLIAKLRNRLDICTD